MKRISTLAAAATVAMTMAAAPASAQLPIEQPDVAGVTGGDGGDAGTGNVQVLNGNSAAVSLLGDAKSEGGDTAAKSGDAYGGDGGDARGSGKGHAEGGDGGNAETGNVQAGNGNSLAVSVGSKQSHSKRSYSKRSHSKGARSEGGDTYARSGDAYGGDGGDARDGKFRDGKSRDAKYGGHGRCKHRREKGGEDASRLFVSGR